VSQDSDSGWCNRGAVEVVGSVELVPQGEFWVQVGSSEKVER